MRIFYLRAWEVRPFYTSDLLIVIKTFLNKWKYNLKDQELTNNLWRIILKGSYVKCNCSL